MSSAWPRLRWWLLALLFVSTVLNYVDRQTLSLLAPTIQADFGMNDVDYAGVVQLFLLAYTLAFLVAGRITDWLGARLSLAVFVAWWSIANMVTGLVQGVGQLGIARFLLGLGEAGNYTGGTKIVAQWFPPQERALGIGLYTAGAMVGATISPPLIGWIGVSYGWRAAFIATGAAGIVWVLAWLLVFRPRTQPPAIDASATVNLAPSTLADEVRLWRQLLTLKPVWALILARLVTDPVWYFYLFWFPKYLSDARHVGLAQLASVAWIVYLAADFGSVLGGVASGRLIRRGMAPVASRLRVMAVAAAIAPFGALIAVEPTLPFTLALGALVAFCHLTWQINLGSLIVDLFPTRHVATVFGLIATGSGIGGLLATQGVAYLVTEHSYAPVFLCMAVLHPVGWILALGARDQDIRIQADTRCA